MENIAVHFNSSLLPSREHWERVCTVKKIPLKFYDTFEPKKHPVCGPSQAFHPDGRVCARVAGAEFQFQLDLYRMDSQRREWLDGQAPHVFDGCDFWACFRHSPASGYDLIGGRLAVATFALITNGIVLTHRVKKPVNIGEEVFTSFRRSAFSIAKIRAAFIKPC